MSPMDLGPGLDIILGWDWIARHDLCFLHPQGEAVGAGPGGYVAAIRAAQLGQKVAIVEREAKRSGIPQALAYAIMREESAFDPEAASGAHAYGLMQLIVPTARTLAKKTGLGVAVDERSLTRPDVNVALGCRFLADLEGRFPKLPWLAIPAYNAGPGAVDRWLSSRTTESFDLWVEAIPYDETRKYTRRVIASFAAYASLYEPDALDAALHLPKTVEAR